MFRDVEIAGVLFESVYNEEYAVASAAFQTLRQLLTEHPDVYLSVISSSAERENIFFGRFHKLLQSGNVVHKRKMLQLLEQLLSTPKVHAMAARTLMSHQQARFRRRICARATRPSWTT